MRLTDQQRSTVEGWAIYSIAIVPALVMSCIERRKFDMFQSQESATPMPAELPVDSLLTLPASAKSELGCLAMQGEQLAA